MKIEIPDRDKILLLFDETEIEFIKREAEANDITVSEMFELLLGILFVGGYSNIIGRT